MVETVDSINNIINVNEENDPLLSEKLNELSKKIVRGFKTTTKL